MIAKYIYERLEKKMPEGVNLKSVTVTEEPGCSASFKKKNQNEPARKFRVA